MTTRQAPLTVDEIKAAVERAKERLRKAFAVADQKYPGAMDRRFVEAVEELPLLTKLKSLNPISVQVTEDALRFEDITFDDLAPLQPTREKRTKKPR